MKVLNNIKNNFEQLKPAMFVNKINKYKNYKNYYLAKDNDSKVNKIDEKLTKLITEFKEYDRKVLEIKNNEKLKLEIIPEDSRSLDNEIVLKLIEDFNDFSESDDSHLKISNLSMHFGGLKAVDNLNFDIKKNEIFGLIGPNGAGKTTAFNCITQFYRSEERRVGKECRYRWSTYH